MLAVGFIQSEEQILYKRLVSASKTSSESAKQVSPMTSYPTQTFTLPYKMKYWKCNLCNIELPDDELATIRKQRHKEFHIDESVGTHKRRRNWTFGEVEYVLT